MVKLLTYYPPAVLAQAVDPATGVPAMVEFLNLAKIKTLLDTWSDIHYERVDRLKRAEQKKLPPPPPMAPEIERKISQGFDNLVAHLKSGFGPSTQS